MIPLGAPIPPEVVAWVFMGVLVVIVLAFALFCYGFYLVAREVRP